MKLIRVLLVLLPLSTPALGGGTSHWTHTSEADFKKGKFHNVVATNLGDVKLSRAIKTLLEQDPRVSAVYALAEGADGTVYAGSGPQGIILQLKTDKVSTLATLEDENVFALLVEKDGKLLVGTGGEHGRILRIDPAKPQEKPIEVLKPQSVQYIWKLVQTDDGMIYAATGPEGQVIQIAADGTSSVVFDSTENNIVSLISDGGDLLYAGTDPNGLVFRINRKTKETFALFDAPESEITAMVLDSKGNLYAATGQAGDLDEAGADQPGAESVGRPEGGESVTPLPSPKPSEPKPPPGPDPNPTEPDPIPKGGLSLMFLGPQANDVDADAEAQPPTPPVPPLTQQAMPLPMPTRSVAPAGARRPGTPEGNAIYRIDRNGFVTEVFREPAIVLSLIEKDGVLLVGTGSEGLVYQVNPAAEENVVLAKVDPKQVTAMLAARDGRVILGLSNVGGLASMSSGFATDGAYTSSVLDAGQISRFGKVRLHGSLPPGTNLTLATRSGNVQEPGDSSWSRWSEEAPAAEYRQITSPSARFLQYRLSFTSRDGASSAVVDEVSVAYQVPNNAPEVKSIRISAAPEEGARPGMPVAMMQNAAAGGARPQVQGRMRMITWEASDPDTDNLDYSLYFRSGTRGNWILLQEKIKEPQFLWDTRVVADGRYQLRIVASDVRANSRGEGRETSRVSDPVMVDNTAPTIGDLKVTRTARGARIEAKVMDRTSSIATLDYAVDSKDDWQAVLPSDNILDSPEEAVAFAVDGLTPGAHQITVRAGDEHGNQAYEAVQIVVEAQAAR